MTISLAGLGVAAHHLFLPNADQLLTANPRVLGIHLKSATFSAIDHLIECYGFLDFAPFSGNFVIRRQESATMGLGHRARRCERLVLRGAPFGQCGFSLSGGGNAARRAISPPSVPLKFSRNCSASCSLTPYVMLPSIGSRFRVFVYYRPNARTHFHAHQWLWP